MKVSKDRRRQCNEENTHCDERLITPSGLVFVGQILGKSSFVKKINRAPISKDYLPKHSVSVLT